MNWLGQKNKVGAGEGSVEVNVPDRDALLGRLDRHLAAGEGFTVATLNLDHVVKLGTDPAFRDAYRRHGLVTADGNPIVWLLRLAGEEVRLVPGSELIVPVARLAARRGVPVALFGATEETLARAAEALGREAPGVEIVAMRAPAMGFDPTGPEADRAIDWLAASGARLCFLALGAPKQEIFAAHAAARLGSVGFLSIGAGLDFLAGSQTRAPALVRAVAAEWLWRLAGNPRRFAARYGACIAILPRLALAAVRARGARRAG